MLDLVTTLDPRFTVAYRFGAIFLTEAYPSGPGRPDLAIALLERGIAQDGGRWEYMHDIGFIYYWWLKDYQEAAEWFDRAGKAPGAPIVAGAAGRDDAGRGRRPAVVAHAVAAADRSPAISTGCATTPSGGCRNSMPWT